MPRHSRTGFGRPEPSLKIAALALMLAAVTLPARGEEQWIIPVYGTHVQGVGNTYDSILALGNPTASTAHVRVTDILPVTSAPCTECRLLNTEIIIPAHGTKRFSSETALAVDAQTLLLGAAVITADQPIEIRSEVVATARGDYRWQTVEIARDWLTGRSRIDRAMRGDEESTNLFLINPNSFEIEIEYSTDRGGFGKTLVPPHSSVFRILQPGWWCPGGCSWIAIIDLGRGVNLEFNSSSKYLAATSNPSRLLAPVVRIPYALR